MKFLFITIFFLFSSVEFVNAETENEIQRHRKQAEFTYKKIIENKEILTKLKISGMLLACGKRLKSKELFQNVLNNNVKKKLPNIAFQMKTNGIPVSLEDTFTILLMTETGLRRFTGGHAFAFAEILSINGQLEQYCKDVVQQYMRGSFGS